MTTGEKFTILDKHNEAMAQCDKAKLLELQVSIHYREAVRLEAEAFAATRPDAQPTYSILARSLACLHMSANQPKKAIELIDRVRSHCDEGTQEELDEIRADAVIDQARRERRYGPDDEDD